MIWLGLAGLRQIDPADHVPIGICLDYLERKLPYAVRQRISGDGEVLELPWQDLPAGPDDFRDRLGELPIVGNDGLAQRDISHCNSPAWNRLDEQLGDRVIGRDLHVNPDGGRLRSEER